MPRKPTWPPVPKLHTNGQLRIKWRGVSYYLGLPGAPDYQERYAALLDKLEFVRRTNSDKPPAPFSSLTVAGAVGLWADEALSAHSVKEQAGFRRALSCLVRVHGTAEAERFGPDELEDVRDNMISGDWLTREERTRRAGPWCRKTANRAVRRIREVWRWLSRKKLVPRDAYAGLLTLRALRRGAAGTHEAPRRPDVSHEDVLRVAGAIRRCCAGRMLAVQLWAGMRSGEVRLMNWDEIDASSEVWVYRPKRHKLSHLGIERTIFLGPEAQAILREQRKAAPRGRLVFPGPGRGPYTSDGYGRVVARAARRVGLERFRAYLARHAARDRVTALHGLDAARAFLGHSGAAMTAQYGKAQDAEAGARAALGAG